MAAPDPTTETLIEAALIRARAQVSHFHAGTGVDSNVKCDRCRKPLNRWDEPCVCDRTEAALLAEDVLALAARLEAAEKQIEGKDKLLRRWLPQRTGGGQR